MSKSYYDQDGHPADRNRQTGSQVGLPIAVRRVSWGAIIAGGVIAMAIWIMLTLLGTGIGMTIAQPSAGGTGTNIGISIAGGIWWIVTGLLALAIGGYAASRLAGVTSTMDGVLQGVTTWAATTLVMFFLLTTVVGGLAGGAFSMASSVASTAGSGVQAAVPAIKQASGISPDDIETKVRGLLTSEPPPSPRQMTPKQAQAAAIALVPDLLSGGQDTEQARQKLVRIVSSQSNMSQQQASQKVDKWEQELQSTAQQVKGTAKQAADTAANLTGVASLWGFVMLVLGAAAGAIGGAIGKRSSAADRF